MKSLSQKNIFNWKIPESFFSIIKNFNQAIKLDSKFTDAFDNRGESYMDLKNYEEAIKDFEMVKLVYNLT